MIFSILLLPIFASPKRFLLLHVIFLLSFLLNNQKSAVEAAPAVVTIVDFTSWSFRGEIASFANPLDEDYAYASNLMAPPDDPQLCEFPPSLLDGNNNTITVEMRTPVALLISLGGNCNPIDKVNIALRIQREVTRAVRYLVFYNNNPNDPDDIPSLRESDFYGKEEQYQSIAVVAVSTTVGSAMLGRIEQLRDVTGANPEFLKLGNSRWQLPMVLELISDRYPSRGGYAPPAPESFYWFRFVLFTLLIISPCCRAGYLWWAGGGRIRFRRNENGRIIGLQYIPPMTYWFASHGGPPGENGPQITDRLTEEEVLALPEIMYRTPKQEADSNNNSINGGSNDINDNSVVTNDKRDSDRQTEVSSQTTLSVDNNEPSSEEVDIVVSAGSDDVAAINEDSGNLVDGPAEEDPNKSIIYSTMSTTCSICIDEFEDGEMIRLLPRCHHAFHTECIMPWLTERQGCCPLCKVSVIEQEQPSSPSYSSSIDNDQAQQQERQQQQQQQQDEGEEGGGFGVDTVSDDENGISIADQPIVAAAAAVDSTNEGETPPRPQQSNVTVDDGNSSGVSTSASALSSPQSQSLAPDSQDRVDVESLGTPSTVPETKIGEIDHSFDSCGSSTNVERPEAAVGKEIIQEVMQEEHGTAEEGADVEELEIRLSMPTSVSASASEEDPIIPIAEDSEIDKRGEKDEEDDFPKIRLDLSEEDPHTVVKRPLAEDMPKEGNNIAAGDEAQEEPVFIVRDKPNPVTGPEDSSEIVNESPPRIQKNLSIPFDEAPSSEDNPNLEPKGNIPFDELPKRRNVEASETVWLTAVLDKPDVSFDSLPTP